MSGSLEEQVVAGVVYIWMNSSPLSDRAQWFANSNYVSDGHCDTATRQGLFRMHHLSLTALLATRSRRAHVCLSILQSHKYVTVTLSGSALRNQILPLRDIATPSPYLRPMDASPFYEIVKSCWFAMCRPGWATSQSLRHLGSRSMLTPIFLPIS